MTTAVIVDAVRTAGGKRHGKLSGWHPVDLAAETLKALVERNDLDPGLVDDVIMGCVMQIGAQAVNIGRNAVLAAGFPESVPATTIDRQCGSSQQAIHFAAQGVMAGQYDVVIAAGVEVMSLVPMGAPSGSGVGFPFGPTVGLRYEPKGGLVPQGISARDDRRPVGPVAGGPGRLQRSQPAERGPGHRRGPVRAGDHAGHRQAQGQGDRQGHRVRRAGHRRRGHPARTRPSRRWASSSRPSRPTAR